MFFKKVHWHFCKGSLYLCVCFLNTELHSDMTLVVNSKSLPYRALASVFGFHEQVTASAYSRPGTNLSTGDTATSGDIFHGHSLGVGVLLASSGQRLGMLLNNLHCKGHPPTLSYPVQNVNSAKTKKPYLKT